VKKKRKPTPHPKKPKLIQTESDGSGGKVWSGEGIREAGGDQKHVHIQNRKKPTQGPHVPVSIGPEKGGGSPLQDSQKRQTPRYTGPCDKTKYEEGNQSEAGRRRKKALHIAKSRETRGGDRRITWKREKDAGQVRPKHGK